MKKETEKKKTTVKKTEESKKSFTVWTWVNLGTMVLGVLLVLLGIFIKPVEMYFS